MTRVISYLRWRTRSMYSVFIINGALGARCVHIFSAYYNTYTLGSALGKSWAHTLISCAPERCTNDDLNIKHC